MTRTYKKKTDRGAVSHDAMLNAVKAVEGGRSIRDVAKETGIPKSSLQRKCAQYSKSENPEQERLDANFKKAQIFNEEEEELIAGYIEKCSMMFYGLSTREARHVAFETAIINKMRMPESWKEKQMAGKDWLWGFLRRNQRLSVRTPEATSIARATAFNKPNLDAFFILLKDTIEKTKASGFTIYNLDETGFTTVQKQGKVLAPKGHKQVGQMTSAERGVLITACCIVSASGTALPPVFIFPRKNFKGVMLHGAPEGSLGIAHPSGWMTKDSFEQVVDHFIKHAKPTEDKPCILLMDNHESHVSLQALQKAKDNNVHVLTLPPHTSNKTQPLDRCVYGPMKQYFNSAANSWMMQNPGRPITIYDMAPLIGGAWIQAATPHNIQSGFSVSGVWPFNPHVFTDADFMPAMVTDRPNPQEAVSTTSEEAMPTTCTSEQVMTTTSEQIMSTACEQAMSTTSAQIMPTAYEQAMPTTSATETNPKAPKKFTSPDMFRGYPKAQPRKQSNRGRKRGKAMVATSTPELKRIQAEETARHGKKAKKVKKSLFLNPDSDSDMDIDVSTAVFSSSSSDSDGEPGDDDSLKLQNVGNVCIDDFVLCEFLGKARTCYYVGKVVENVDSDGDIAVQFYKRQANSISFVVSSEDVALFPLNLVRAILPAPKPQGTTSRTQVLLTFSVNFGDLMVK